MTIHQAFGIGKPGFDLPLEPGFIEGDCLASDSQLLKLSDQVFLPGFFRLELGKEGVHRLAFPNRIDQVVLVGFDQGKFPLDIGQSIELRPFSRPMLGKSLLNGDFHHLLGQRFMERLEHDLIEELLFDQQ